MRLGTRVWGIGKFLVLVGALGLTFLVFFGLAMRIALRAREVEVPSLAGKTVNDATRIAAATGLAVRVDANQRSDEQIPAGRMALGVPARVREGYQVPAGYTDHPVQSYVQRGRRFRAELRRLEA